MAAIGGQRSEWHGIAAGIASSLLGGTAVAATRFVIGETDPLTLALLRYGVAAACLSPVLLFRRTAPVRGDLLAVVALGLLFFALFPSLFNAALALTTAGRGALALSTLPLFTMAIAALLRVEPMTGPKLAGVLLAVGGVAIALSAKIARAPPDAWRGDLLMCATALCGALFNVLSRPYVKRYGALPFMARGMLAGTISLALAVGTRGSFPNAASFSPGGWAAVVFLGTIGAALTFYLWTWALARASPTRVAVTVTANPVAAMTVGALWLGEGFSVRLLGGFAAVVVGIVLASRGAKVKVPPRAASRFDAAAEECVEAERGDLCLDHNTKISSSARDTAPAAQQYQAKGSNASKSCLWK
jgi:drug/metabolite transporter (DMT)-like permease